MYYGRGYFKIIGLWALHHAVFEFSAEKIIKYDIFLLKAG